MHGAQAHCLVFEKSQSSRHRWQDLRNDSVQASGFTNFTGNCITDKMICPGSYNRKKGETGKEPRCPRLIPLHDVLSSCVIWPFLGVSEMDLGTGFQGGPGKAAQSRGLNTAETCSLPALEAASPTSRCWQGLIPPEGSRKNLSSPLLAPGGCWRSMVFPGSWQPNSSLCPCVRMAICPLAETPAVG